MSIESLHPAYVDMQDIWAMVRDSYDGEYAIKEGAELYLPPTSGMRADGFGTTDTDGQRDYDAYKLRAVYPDLFREAIQSAVGTMHMEDPIIELPASMEILRERATVRGESLVALLRRINAAQLSFGRIGLAGDFMVDGSNNASPYISTYGAGTIKNWAISEPTNGIPSTGLVVLDESGPVMQPDMSWEVETRYRVLALIGKDGKPDPNGTTYATAILGKGQGLESAVFTVPSRMGTRLESIPFAFVNSRDTVPEPDMPPLIGLALLCLAIYRGEADYRQSLFMQGQDTLVEVGNTASADEYAARRTGAGASIKVPIGGDAKYIGVSSNGLPEQRTSLENDYARASQRGGALLDATSRSKESGEALRIRIAAQTTTLPQVALAGAAALTDVLQAMAPWFKADPTQISVQPNMDFTADMLDGQTLVDVMTAKGLGAPFSLRSIHAWGQDQGMTDKSFEAEMAEIEGESFDDEI